MNVNVQGTLSKELVDAIEQAANGMSRSEFLERAAWEAIRRIRREARDAKDRAIYEKYADEFAKEAEAIAALQGDEW